MAAAIDWAVKALPPSILRAVLVVAVLARPLVPLKGFKIKSTKTLVVVVADKVLATVVAGTDRAADRALPDRATDAEMGRVCDECKDGASAPLALPTKRSWMV